MTTYQSTQCTYRHELYEAVGSSPSQHDVANPEQILGMLRCLEDDIF